MISNQVLQKAADELKAITRTEFAIHQDSGELLVSTGAAEIATPEMVSAFAQSPADSQVMGVHHLLKVFQGEELQYVVDALGLADDAYTMGRILVAQIGQLLTAYKARFDRNHFFQDLLLDNLLLVDIFNQAKHLHIADKVKRVVYRIEPADTGIKMTDTSVSEMLQSMYTTQNGDYITGIEENSVILIKALDFVSEDADAQEEELLEIARTIVDMCGSEAMVSVRVSFGNVVKELKDVSKSYKEARMASQVGGIFYQGKAVVPYSRLGIGRLIYQLPVSLCEMFIDEIFGGEVPEELDEETMLTVDKFFENSLNVSETARQLYVHRNTLVYRLEKLQKATGLDVRSFDDAMTLKIALMVVSYKEYLDGLAD